MDIREYMDDAGITKYEGSLVLDDYTLIVSGYTKEACYSLMEQELCGMIAVMEVKLEGLRLERNSKIV